MFGTSASMMCRETHIAEIMATVNLSSSITNNSPRRPRHAGPAMKGSDPLWNAFSDSGGSPSSGHAESVPRRKNRVIQPSRSKAASKRGKEPAHDASHGRRRGGDALSGTLTLSSFGDQESGHAREEGGATSRVDHFMQGAHGLFGMQNMPSSPGSSRPGSGLRPRARAISTRRQGNNGHSAGSGGRASQSKRATSGSKNNPEALRHDNPGASTLWRSSLPVKFRRTTGASATAPLDELRAGGSSNGAHGNARPKPRPRGSLGARPSVHTDDDADADRPSLILPPIQLGFASDATRASHGSSPAAPAPTPRPTTLVPQVTQSQVARAVAKAYDAGADRSAYQGATPRPSANPAVHHSQQNDSPGVWAPRLTSPASVTDMEYILSLQLSVLPSPSVLRTANAAKNTRGGGGMDGHPAKKPLFPELLETHEHANRPAGPPSMPARAKDLRGPVIKQKKCTQPTDTDKCVDYFRTRSAAKKRHQLGIQSLQSRHRDAALSLG